MSPPLVLCFFSSFLECKSVRVRKLWPKYYNFTHTWNCRENNSPLFCWHQYMDPLGCNIPCISGGKKIWSGFPQTQTHTLSFLKLLLYLQHQLVATPRAFCLIPPFLKLKTAKKLRLLLALLNVQQLLMLYM